MREREEREREEERMGGVVRKRARWKEREKRR